MTHLQSLLFHRGVWKSPEECVEFLKRHDMRHDKVHTTPNYYRFRQRPLEDGFIYRTICLGKGLAIKAVLAISEKTFFKGGFEWNIMPPSVERFMEKYGEHLIVSANVCRVPLAKTLEKLGNILTLGKFNKSKASLGYSSYFHLYLNLTLDDGHKIHLEKNQTLNFREGEKKPISSTCIEVPGIGAKHLTLSEFFNNALNQYGKDRIFVYDAVNRNCQAFVKDLLTANSLWNSELEKFVIQNVGDSTNWLLRKAMKLGTNLASNLSLIGQKVRGGRYVLY